MDSNFYFVGLPYIALLLFFGGITYRAFSGIMGSYRGRWDWSARGDYYWTTRSTGFFGRASIGPAALCLHWGVLILFVAHIVGFIGGAYALTAWVEVFRWSGLGAGLMMLYGLIWAFVRRLMIPQVRVMSRTEDYAVLIFLITIASLGLYQSGVELVFGISYSAGPWIASVLLLRPDATLMAGVPLVNKLHVIIALLFIAYLPFTKLVHALSYPFGYLGRAFISVRSYQGAKK
ncbi:MAG: respiratory nitrate reductase subunit gamma [Deltaproteobacteria bacterium]|nr:respiratory nitrate reductase subunit gamma [Deltaproteobacteria bacterium]